MRRARTRGFTLIEIMVSLVVAMIGLFGVMAILRTTGRSNRLARQLAGATACATDVLEDLRSADMTTIGTAGTYPNVVTPDGTTYHKTYAVTTLAGSATVALITATSTFSDDIDGSVHTASLQLVRTTKEKL